MNVPAIIFFLWVLGGLVTLIIVCRKKSPMSQMMKWWQQLALCLLVIVVWFFILVSWIRFGRQLRKLRNRPPNQKEVFDERSC